MELLFILPALGWLIAATLLHQILSLPFVKARVQRVTGSAARPPEGMADLVDKAAEELTLLGFEGPRAAWLEDDSRSEISRRFQSAWVHPDEGIIVYLLPPENAEHPDQLNTLFVSRLKDGRLLISQAFDPFFVIGSNEQVQGRVIAGDSLLDQFNLHRLWVNGQDAPLDRSLGRSRLVDELLAGALNQQRRELIGKGLLREDSSGVARPGLRLGLRMLRIWFKRPKPPASAAEVPLQRLLLMDQVVDRVRGYAPTKGMQWTLFGGSVVAFLLLGSVIFDLTFAVLVAVVIAIHELGHFLAMRAFGYRQVRMMLLPMVGGVTIGYEEKPDPVRRGWVSLMGPLPGIILGAGLLWLMQWPGVDVVSLPPWLGTLAWLLLVINYLNLLPVPPLDGGRLVEDLLPARWAWLRVLVVVGLCAIGILVSVLMGFWLLVVIIALPLLTIPGFLTAARAARQVDGEGLARKERPQRMRTVLEALENVAGPARQVAPRLALAEEVLRIVRFEPVGLGRQVSLGTIYVVVLLAPLGTSAAAMVLWFGLLIGYDYDYDDGGFAEVYDSLQLELESLPLENLLDRYLDDQDEVVAALPATDNAIDLAEQKLGQPLPPALQRFYARTNGLDSLAIAPVAELSLAPECLEPVFAHYARMQQEFDADADLIFLEDRQHRVRPDEVYGWICLGPVDVEDLNVLAIAPGTASRPAGQGFLIFSDYGIEAYADLETWLRDQVLGHEVGRWHAAHYQSRRASMDEELDRLSTALLLEKMPQPGFLERRAMGWPSLPGPARSADLAAAEQRLGLSLPGELQELYARHDGYYPWEVVPVGELVFFDAWPDADDSIVWYQDEQDRWQLAGPGGGSELDVARSDLDRCLVIGKSMNGFMDTEMTTVPATLFWCPELAGGVALDFRRQVYFPALRELFADRTAMRMLMP